MTEIRREEELAISNEFADIRVVKVVTPDGERLEVSAPRRGLVVLLDATELETLTWQSSETFSRFLESSIGPDQEDGPSPG